MIFEKENTDVDVAKDIVVDSYMDGFSAQTAGFMAGVSKTTALRWLREEGVSIRSGVSRYNYFDSNAFNRELTEYTAWVLGVLYGDGTVHGHANRRSVSDTVSVTNTYDVCLKIREILGAKNKIEKHENWSRLSIYSTDLAESLRRHGVYPRKARTMAFPWHLDECLISHFMRGMWDADGWILQKSNRPTMITGLCLSSEEFVRTASEVVEDVIGSSVSVRKRVNRDEWSFQVGSFNALRWCEWIYSGSEDKNRSDLRYQRFLKFSAKEFRDRWRKR